MLFSWSCGCSRCSVSMADNFTATRPSTARSCTAKEGAPGGSIAAGAAVTAGSAADETGIVWPPSAAPPVLAPLLEGRLGALKPLPLGRCLGWQSLPLPLLLVPLSVRACVVSPPALKPLPLGRCLLRRSLPLPLRSVPHPMPPLPVRVCAVAPPMLREGLWVRPPLLLRVRRWGRGTCGSSLLALQTETPHQIDHQSRSRRCSIDRSTPIRITKNVWQLLTCP